MKKTPVTKSGTAASAPTVSNPYRLSGNLSPTVAEAFGGLSLIPSHWVGATVGQEMKDASYRHWKQIEWQGFYFEFLAPDFLPDTVKMHDRIPSARRDVFDADTGGTAFDLKTHVLTNARGGANTSIPWNDGQSIEDVVKRDGQIGLVVAHGEASFGNLFETWRVAAAGGLSKVQLENRRLGRRKRKRKDTFRITKLAVYVFSAADFAHLKKAGVIKVFNQGRQHTGEARATKYTVAISKVQPTLVIPLVNP